MHSFSKRVASVAAVAALSAAAVPAASAATVETVATGLDNPRGVAVGPDGAVYVANTGRGGKQCQGKGEEALCLGKTSRIVRVRDGQTRTVARGFASVSSPGGAFAIAGATGVSAAPDGSVFTVTGSGMPQDVKSMPPVVRGQAGTLFNVNGGLSAVARIDRLEHRRNLDGVKGDKNSNPYAVLALSANHQIVVDAGANAVLEVKDGKAKLLSLIPNRRNGRRQSVPSSIALGPDGAYYVGELAESSGKGKARVWRVPAEGGTATVYRSGFTTISGVAFGPDGSLYVTEFALSFETFAGRLVRVAPDGSRSVLAGGKKLRAPTGAAVDSTGAVYVSNFSVLPRKTPKNSPFRGAGGTLVKITP